MAIRKNFKARSLRNAARVTGGTRTYARFTDIREILPRLLCRNDHHHAVTTIIGDFAQTIAPLDPFVYQWVDGVKKRLPGHRLSKTLDSPSYHQSGYDWRAAGVVDFLVASNVYFERVPSLDGSKEYCEIIERGSVTPELVGKSVVYSVKGRDEKLTADRIIHVKAPSWDGGISGADRLKMCASALEAANLEEQYSADLMGNNGVPSGFLVTSEELEETQRKETLKAYERRHVGKGKGGRVGLLSGGMRFEATGLSPEALQLDATRKANLEAIARIFRYPLSMLMGGPVTFDDRQQFFRSVRGILEAFEAAFTYSLLTEEERSRGLFVEFDTTTLQRACSALQAADLVPFLDTPILERNEYRTALGYEAKDGYDNTVMAVNNLRLVDSKTLVPVDGAGEEVEPVQPVEPVVSPQEVKVATGLDTRKAALRDIADRVLRRARRNLNKEGVDVEKVEFKEALVAREILVPYAGLLSLDVEKSVEILRSEFYRDTGVNAVADRLMEGK